MATRPLLSISLIIGITALGGGAGRAGVPDPAASVCVVTVFQNPARPACLALAPVAVRLCPQPGATPRFDVVSFAVTVNDAAGFPCPKVMVTAVETAGSVNISSSTADITLPDGSATVDVFAAGGYGSIGVCADGVLLLCTVEVRSPDVAFGATPPACPLPTVGSSFVNASDLVNPACGYLSKFGPVVPGVNNSWDLDCNGTVNSSDILGTLGKGGVQQHYSHGAVLGEKAVCVP